MATYHYNPESAEVKPKHEHVTLRFREEKDGNLINVNLAARDAQQLGLQLLGKDTLEAIKAALEYELAGLDNYEDVRASNIAIKREAILAQVQGALA